MTLAGTRFTFATGEEDASLRGYAGVAVSRALSSTAKLFGAAEASYNSTGTVALGANLGLKVSF